MRENRTSGSEGGGTGNLTGPSYPIGRIVGLKRHFVAAGLVPDVGFLRVNEADSFFKGTRSLDPNCETLKHRASHEKLLMLT